MNDFTVEEFSFLCRGLITLPFFKLSNNAEYANQIFSYIEEKIDKVNNLFVFQGFNLLLSVNPCEKSLELLQKSFYILSENQNFINSLDEHVEIIIKFYILTYFSGYNGYLFFLLNFFE